MEIVDNLVEHLEVRGKLSPVWKYWLEDHSEFRPLYQDPASGKRHFICARSIEAAREAATRLKEPVLTPAQVQTTAIQQAV